MNKERKFGAGCVDQWLRDRDLLCARARRLLLPSFATLRQQPFLFGARPTLADTALYGQALMLREADPELVVRVGPELAEHAARMDTFLRPA